MGKGTQSPLLWLTPHASHIQQPLDLGIFGIMKNTYKEPAAMMKLMEKADTPELRKKIFQDLYLDKKKMLIKYGLTTQSEKILSILESIQKESSRANVCSSFLQTGFVRLFSEANGTIKEKLFFLPQYGRILKDYVDEGDQRFYSPQIQKMIKFSDECGVLCAHPLTPSFNKLKEWSGKQNCSVLFDSNIDGYGKGVIEHKVMNKRNLYFISFDNQNNVFGGYVDTIISKTNCFTSDPNAFVFSLIRNGQVKNMNYNIRNQGHAFWLQSNHDQLYVFGGCYDSSYDVNVWKIGYKSNYTCKPCDYEYNGEQQPLRDNTNNYIIKRILVLEMS
ncbi:TLDc domain-containing protein [Entamoeba marina]